MLCVNGKHFLSIFGLYLVKLHNNHYLENISFHYRQTEKKLSNESMQLVGPKKCHIHGEIQYKIYLYENYILFAVSIPNMCKKFY